MFSCYIRKIDLTPVDFWGYIKNQLFVHYFDTEDQLLKIVSEAFNSVTSDLVYRVVDSKIQKAYVACV